MTGLLFLGGNGPSLEQYGLYRFGESYVIAADSGLETAVRLGVEPHLVVGDMDSLASGRLLEKIPPRKIVRFPEDKDETDAEIGMRMMHDRGVERVVLIGGGEGRLAHLLGILQLFERDYAPDMWITAREEVSVVETFRDYQECRGQIFSFFPLGGAARGLASTGLKWPLNGLSWEPDQCGISNVALEDRVEVSVESGRLLAIREI